MGVGPSLGDFLRGVDDQDLTKLVTEAYRLDPQRMEKVFADARKRCHEGVYAFSLNHRRFGLPDPLLEVRAPASDDAAPSDDDKLPDPAARLSSDPSLATGTQAPLSESPSSALAFEPTPQTPTPTPTQARAEPQPLTSVAQHGATPRGDGGKDRMNALWDFEGHVLLELQPASLNPYNLAQQPLRPADASAGSTGASTGAVAPEVDEDGNAILYGSCGRDKRYARCAVCYFRGLRCNTGHYCACCQRPVCIRPRKYPGEEHPKICWNVLHMDKDMVQRVEKKKKRKLQIMSVVPVGGTSSSLLSSTAMSSGAARKLPDDHGHDQQEPMVQMAALTSDQDGAVTLDPDARRQLADALSTTSVAL